MDCVSLEMDFPLQLRAIGLPSLYSTWLAMHMCTHWPTSLPHRPTRTHCPTHPPCCRVYVCNDSLVPCGVVTLTDILHKLVEA